MAEFTVNAQRFDSYKNFKFRMKWDGHYVAGISKVSALRRSTEHREGGDPSARRKSPGLTKFDPITLGARRHPSGVRAMGQQGLAFWCGRRR